MARILRVCLLSCFRPVQIFETLWTTVCQAPPSMGFPRQEYWRGYQGLVQGIFLIQGSTHVSYISCRRWAGSLPLAPPGKPQTLPVCLSVKVAQSCPILCNSMDYTVHGILQARILDWVAFPFSRGSSEPRDRTQVSHIAGRFFTS